MSLHTISVLVEDKPGVLTRVAGRAWTLIALKGALRTGDAEIERRRQAVSRERARLLDGLAELPVDVSPSQANFVWLPAHGMSGNQLAHGLRRQGVIVAAGGPLGADDHIRATVRDAAATDRLLRALGVALHG